jgi:hypothetical protein
MLRRARPHLTYANVMVTILAFIVLGGTAVAATGGNFILGQSNTAGAPTRLSSPTTDANGVLRVGNTSTTGAGHGIVANGGAGGFGVWALGGDASKNTAAIHGLSYSGNAVEGISGKSSASGVYGQNNATGFGVAGRATSGVGVMGDSSTGWAMQAFGNASQSRAANGFVKAMAFINDNDPADPVKQCFNSQLPPFFATSGNCGITVSIGTISDALNFGFQIDDRFVSVTEAFGPSIIVRAVAESSNVLDVTGYLPNENILFSPQHYYIVVY